MDTNKCVQGIVESHIGISVISVLVTMSAALFCLGGCKTPQPALVAPGQVRSSPATCKPIVRTFHAETFREQGRTYAAMNRSHLGLDFEACSDEHVIAIADGRVTYVGAEERDEYSGGGKVLRAFHMLPGQGKKVTWYTYAHLTNVRVAIGTWVKRGDVIADLWHAHAESDWKPHVHLQLDDDSIPLERRDPLPRLGGCESQAAKDALIFPVRC